jgi:hypothetical protein
VSRYKFAKWMEISPGTVCFKWPLVRSRYKHYVYVLRAETVCKNRDKPIKHTVRVMLRLLFNLVDESEVNA